MPLLTDEDGDGVCDGINPMVEPGAGGATTAVVVTLEPITDGGASFYEGGQNFATPSDPRSGYFFEGTDTHVYSACQTEGTATTEPAMVCDESSPLTRVIPRFDDASVPGIYGKGPAPPRPVWATPSTSRSRSPRAGPARPCAPRTTSQRRQLPASARLFPRRHGRRERLPGSVGTVVTSGLPSCTDGCTPPRSFRDVAGLQLIGPL